LYINAFIANIALHQRLYCQYCSSSTPIWPILLSINTYIANIALHQRLYG
jgi:hypothetical protein